MLSMLSISIAKQNKMTLETDLVGSLKILVFVARELLREENQVTLNERDAKENVEVDILSGPLQTSKMQRALQQWITAKSC